MSVGEPKPIAIDVGTELRPDGAWGVLLQMSDPDTWVLMRADDARHVAALLLGGAYDADELNGDKGP